MVDIVDPVTRSRMMSGIRSANTKPEMLVRSHLHSRGLRFVLDGAGLPGRPDIVLPKWETAIFIHGCFWHWHGCSLSKIPTNNQDFWQQKLSANQNRDIVSMLTLLSAGWRVASIWECALRGKPALQALDESMDTLACWVKHPNVSAVLEIPTLVNQN